MIVHDAAVPRVVKLGRIESLGNIWRDQEVWPEGRTFPGILVIEFRGPLSFASADHFLEEVEQKRLLEEEDDNHIEAIEMLRELLTEWRKRRNISCIVADAKSRVRLLLEENFADGAKPLLDQQAFMISLDDAVSFAKLTMARKRKKIAAQDDSAVPRRWGSSQVDGGKIAGESWRIMGIHGGLYHLSSNKHVFKE
ncbi:unnamed protein product [Cladocopium goreaui]|uniref:Sulfate transporter 4.1, chloroplastic (AST82) n=1 Tax=Cladocopium goreaui TaxID=2562237 RepID=A0A9P1GRD2_9DINO|nr:unnamed protein product [Cladocopium goreaui]